MKYDDLEKVREYLDNKYSVNTAKKYYAALLKIYKEIPCNTLEEVSKDTLLNVLKGIKGKNEFSAVKNGLLAVKKCFPGVKILSEKEFKEESLKRKNHSKKPKKTIVLDSYKRKINQISDKKLKLAYRLGMVSGLRVSELAALKPEDISFKDDGIISVHVINGKGGKSGNVECMEDLYLHTELQKFITETVGPGERIFYAANTMVNKARKLGIECHDLRRIFAIVKREELRKEVPITEANQQVMEQLRHSRFSTTKRYLFNRKLVYKEKTDKIEENLIEEKENEKPAAKDPIRDENVGVSQLDKSNIYEPAKPMDPEGKKAWESSIESIGKFDMNKVSSFLSDYRTDEVILTPERREHIVERRGIEFYLEYHKHFKAIVTEPDYVFKDFNAEKSALVIKKIGDKYIKLAIRFATAEDNPDYKNSIITAIGINEKRFQRFLRNNEGPIYKKE